MFWLNTIKEEKDSVAIYVLSFLYRQFLFLSFELLFVGVFFKFFNVIEGVLQWECTPMKLIVFRISIKDISGSAAVKDVLMLILICSQVKILSGFA